MKNQFTLAINTPCHENFNKFKPTTSGGYCNSCKTNVVDFTNMSSKDIINYFHENKNRNICGRFSNHQLKTYSKTQEKNKYVSFWKGISLACLSLFTFNNIQAQENKKSNLTNQIIQEQQEIIVSGVVSDESGPLPGVNIYLEGSSIGVETDFDGNFKFPKKLKKGNVLVFSFIGLESKKITINNKNSSATINLNVNMKSDNCILLGKVAVKQVYKSKNK